MKREHGFPFSRFLSSRRWPIKIAFTPREWRGGCVTRGDKGTRRQKWQASVPIHSFIVYRIYDRVNNRTNSWLPTIIRTLVPSPLRVSPKPLNFFPAPCSRYMETILQKGKKRKKNIRERDVSLLRKSRGISTFLPFLFIISFSPGWHRYPPPSPFFFFFWQMNISEEEPPRKFDGTEHRFLYTSWNSPRCSPLTHTALLSRFIPPLSLSPYHWRDVFSPDRGPPPRRPFFLQDIAATDNIYFEKWPAHASRPYNKRTKRERKKERKNSLRSIQRNARKKFLTSICDDLFQRYECIRNNKIFYPRFG